MSKPLLGALVGTVLGILDGLSAWFSPEARPIFMSIVIGSTLKGLVTGLLAGLIARWRRSTLLGIVAGLLIGFALSSVVALSQPGHYMEIVLPGMLVGALVGFVTQRYPSVPGPRGSGAAVGLLAIAWVLIPSHLPASAQQPRPADPLKAVAWLIGEWSGTSEGQPGRGTVERQYERALGGRFIRAKNRVVYRPLLPKGSAPCAKPYAARRRRISPSRSTYFKMNPPVGDASLRSPGSRASYGWQASVGSRMQAKAAPP